MKIRNQCLMRFRRSFNESLMNGKLKTVKDSNDMQILISAIAFNRKSAFLFEAKTDPNRAHLFSFNARGQ